MPGNGCVKASLVMLNVLFLIAGLALIAGGVWLIIEDSMLMDQVGALSYVVQENYLRLGIYSICGIGAFMVLTSGLGVVGACKEQKVCLGFYIYIIIVLLAAQVGGVVMCFMYQNMIQSVFQKKAKEKFEDVTENYYNSTENEWSEFATMLNVMQQEFKCCGIESESDYDDINFGNLSVKTCRTRPCSCYEKYHWTDSAITANDLISRNINVTALYEDGCQKKLLDTMRRHSRLIMYISGAVAVLQLSGLIMAVYICCNARRAESYRMADAGARGARGGAARGQSPH